VCNIPNEITIDDMPVYIKLVYNPIGKSVRIVLYNINIIRYTEIDDDDDYNLYPNNWFQISADLETDTTINNIINNLKETIASLRFDAYLGKFIKNDEIDRLQLDTDILELFKNIPTVKTSKLRHSDNCCVCLQDTTCKTNCDHYLCFRCVVQLIPNKIISEDDEDEYELWCPICRSELLY
jgi:hypothetical protein